MRGRASSFRHRNNTATGEPPQRLRRYAWRHDRWTLAGAPAPKPHGRLTHWFVGISAALSLVIAAGSAYGFVAYQQAEACRHRGGPLRHDDVPNASNEPQVARWMCRRRLQLPLARQRLPGRASAQEEQTEFGTDQQIGGENRADTIMLVHTDPALEKAIILSFPRDLWVDIPGHGEDKINAAFEGGVDGGGPTCGQDRAAAHGAEDRSLPLRRPRRVPRRRSTTLGGVDMCITGENVNTPGLRRVRDGRRHDQRGLLQRAGLHRRSADRPRREARLSAASRRSGAGLRPDPAPQVRLGGARTSTGSSRQQQFLRAVINRLLQPEQFAQLPFDDQADPVEPAAGTKGSTRPISPTSRASCKGSPPARPSSARSRPTRDPSNLGILRMDPVGRADLRRDPAGQAAWERSGEDTVYTPPSEATVPVLVVDHASGGKVTQVHGRALASRVRYHARRRRPTPRTAKKVAGQRDRRTRPDADAKAQVVAKYFPNLELQEVEGLPDDVVVFVDATYKPVPVGGGSTAESDLSGAERLMRALVLSGGEGSRLRPHHAHQRQAADPGRRHPDPVPRARGDRRRRHHRGRHHRRVRPPPRCAARWATGPAGACRSPTSRRRRRWASPTP